MSEESSIQPMTDPEPFAPGSDAAAVPHAVPASLAAQYARGGLYRFLIAPDGVRLRYAVWRQPGDKRKGRILLLGGRGEFVEKYAGELVGELLGRGFDVWSLDWRGQGLSQRLLADPEKGHIEDFATYVRDLRLFLTTCAGRDPAPTIALAHSMGGHILLRYLAESGGAPAIDAAVLCSPMMALRHAMLIRAALLTAPAGTARAEAYAWGSGPFDKARKIFAQNRVTSDPRRYAFTEEWFAADRRLRLGGPTYAWLRAALRSINLSMRPSYLDRITAPLLVLSAGQDLLVDPASHERACRLLPQARLHRYADARHEIMMERDAIRARFWADFDAFAADRLAGASGECRPDEG